MRATALWVRPFLLSLILTSFAMLVATGRTCAHEPRPVPEPEAHPPSALPDRVILTWTGDPATSQAVTWRTDTTVAPGMAIAQIAPAGPGPQFAEQAETIEATTTPLATDLGEAHYHTVEFTALEPKTKYAYRVGDGANWTEWFHFQTASDAPEPFCFIYFGDAQNDIKTHWSRVVREAQSDAPKARFFLHAGDLINRANRDAEWGEWFAAAGWLNAMIPSIPSPGNHEYERDENDQRQLSRHWRPQFALPEHGPEGLEETAYYLDIQGVRVVSLNSNEKQAEQAEWLESILSDNPNTWTILTFHHPIHSTARGRDNARLRELWQPIFDKYGVDLVLQGHDHTYARSGLEVHNVPTGVNVRDPEGGTVYVVSVSGPKMYNLEPAPWMKRAAEDTQLYQIITIDGETLTYEARTATGQLYDAFELHKRDGQPNELIDKAPEVPERRREPAEAAAAGR